MARYKAAEPAPVNYKELTDSKLLTRTREILTFENTQLGQTFYTALYWQNKKGVLGPPSPIQKRLIA